MAAGIASVGELPELPCYEFVSDNSKTICGQVSKHTIMVYKRALVKPEVPTRSFAVWNSDWKSDCTLIESSDCVAP